MAQVIHLGVSFDRMDLKMEAVASTVNQVTASIKKEFSILISGFMP